MRPGLVAVGAAFVLVGAGLIVAVLWPANAPEVQRNGSVAIESLNPGNFTVVTVPANVASAASISLRWSATAAVDVDWFLTFPCQSATGWCYEPQPAASWSSATSGTWTHSGAAPALYVLYVQNAVTTPVNVSASFVENYHPSPLALPLLPLALVLTGGSLLLGTGAVALYLGMFLPAGIFSPLDRMSDGFLYGGLDEPEGDTPPRTEPPPE